jgi:SAM-dependent methyltransferase
MSIENGRIAGSFRDPSGYVFARNGCIFRAIDEGCHRILGKLLESGLVGTLACEGTVVKTEVVEERLQSELAAEHPGFHHFLQHELLWPITYPYEWSISMLADAGVQTLDLQMRLLQAGYSLKDATAYNIQFVSGRPRFIDVSSIECPNRLDLWIALGQFEQMFVFPLLLCRRLGWDLRSYFLANLGGRDVEQVARGFSWFQRLWPELLLDVTLPVLLSRWAGGGGRAQREKLEKPRTNTGPQLANLRRLRSKITKLAAKYKPRGIWANYTRICNYDDEAERAKKRLVQEFFETTNPKSVVDLGCNTGDYSRLAAACGAQVIAADADHDAVEVLYRRLRETPAPIQPMVIDLCNPSPGVGYMNRERAPFLERIHGDCVLALALLHHLLVSGNLSLDAARDLLFAVTRRDLILEFVPTDDDMFLRLLQLRVNLFEGLTLDKVREVFCERFRLLKEEPVPGSKRTLLFMRRADRGNDP